jgi:transcriptional regulator with XRE-family HTH domain
MGGEMKLGEVIRQVRKEKGWQQEELAQKTGLNQAYISRIEIHIEPDFSTACKILNALDLNIEETWEKIKPKERVEVPCEQ